jgi:hypothetical protein
MYNRTHLYAGGSDTFACRIRRVRPGSAATGLTVQSKHGRSDEYPRSTRHAKLGLIGKEQNWTLAAYESHQLKDALSSIAKLRPRFRNQSVADLVESMTGDAIKALDQAIGVGDAHGFTEAYSRLTVGCNGCHATLGQAYVVIQVPDQSAFPNQDFRAPVKSAP